MRSSLVERLQGLDMLLLVMMISSSSSASLIKTLQGLHQRSSSRVAAWAGLAVSGELQEGDVQQLA